MKEIKVLGSGCAKCKTTAEMISQAAHKAGVDIHLTKVEDYPEIMRYGVMSTPAVVVDEKVVHAGGLPKPEAIERWLQDDLS